MVQRLGGEALCGLGEALVKGWSPTSRYVAAVAAAAAVVVLIDVRDAYESRVPWMTWAALAATTVVYLSTNVAIRTSGESRFFALGEIPAVVAAVLLPRPGAVLAIATGSVLAHTLVSRRAFLPAVLTTASDTLSVALALVCARSASSVFADGSVAHFATAVAVAGTTVGLVSKGIIDGVIACAERRPWVSVVRDTKRLELLVSSAATVGGGALALAGLQDVHLLLELLVPASLAMVLSNSLVRERTQRQMLGAVLSDITHLNSLLEPRELEATLVASVLTLTHAPRAAITGAPPADGEIGMRLPRRTGQQQWLTIEPRKNRGGLQHDDRQLLHTLAAAAAVALDNAELHGHLSGRATRDGLTGLCNRETFGELLDHELARAAREDRRLSVLFIDLDRFKHVNDSFGHLVGDELLRQVATRLRDSLRDSDVLARFGGDEFAILLPNPQDTDDTRKAADRVAAALSEDFLVNGQRLTVSASVGASTFPDDVSDARQLLHRADINMFTKKRARQAPAAHESTT